MAERDTAPQTVIIERTGGGAGMLIGIAVLIVAVVGAYFLIVRNNSATAKDNAIAGAAKSVERTANTASVAVDRAAR